MHVSVIGAGHMPSLVNRKRCTPKQCTNALPRLHVGSVGGGSMVTPVLAAALLAVCAAAAAY